MADWLACLPAGGVQTSHSCSCSRSRIPVNHASSSLPILFGHFLAKSLALSGSWLHRATFPVPLSTPALSSLEHVCHSRIPAPILTRLFHFYHKNLKRTILHSYYYYFIDSSIRNFRSYDCPYSSSTTTYKIIFKHLQLR